MSTSTFCVLGITLAFEVFTVILWAIEGMPNPFEQSGRGW